MTKRRCDEPDEPEAPEKQYYFQVYQSLTVVEYTPGKVYTVDIEPRYNLYRLEGDAPEPGDSDEPIATDTLPNSQLKDDVKVSLAVPTGITLDETTYVLHRRGDGSMEYIRPEINGTVITFFTDSFSQFSVVSDSRSVDITFPIYDEETGASTGTVTITYTPAEIGKELRKSEYGWTIHGKRYTTFEEELFDVEGALQAEPADPPVNPGGGGGAPTEPALPFTDVTEGDWFYDAVAYVYENGIMAGTSETIFSPSMKLNRAQAAQLFYNLEGKPAVAGDSAFTDVASSHWAVDAITWAAENDVVAGIGGNLYDPDSNVTREQFAQMLYNYAQYKGYDLTASGDLTQFPDAGFISSWAETALSWANGKGLINGHENGTIDPKGSTIRAQAASIMANFDQNVAK